MPHYTIYVGPHTLSVETDEPLDLANLPPILTAGALQIRGESIDAIRGHESLSATPDRTSSTPFRA